MCIYTRVSDHEIPDCSPNWGQWGSVGARGGPGSWLTRTAVEANDRWWETLLAATCYLEVEPRQHSRIKFKTVGFSIYFPIWWNDIGQAAGAATYKPGAGVDPEVDLTVCDGCIRAMGPLPIWP